VNDEHATPNDTGDPRVEERDGQAEPTGREEEAGERVEGDSTDDSGSSVGITDADMDQIRSFLQTQHHRRTVDDLRPSSSSSER